MEDSPPLVSIVVVSLDGRALLEKCLASLYAQRYRPIEVIVVDNGSREDIAGLVVERFAQARYIRLSENAGFAGGCNRGMAAAAGEYIALINNDAVAEPEWVGAMVAAAQSDPSVGAVAPMIIDGNMPGRLDSCGVGVGLDGMSRQAMRGVPLEGLQAPSEVLVPSGCACLYRTAALKETGLFDEDFFAYCEDTDLGLRLRWAGWRCATASGARVRHDYSMTTGRASVNKLFWVERNHFWVALKNFPLPLLFLVPFVTLWRFAVQALLMLKGGGGLRDFAREDGFASVVATVLKAQISAVAGAPSMIGKRLSMRSVRRMRGIDMARLILRHRMSIYEILAGRKDARN